jgi:hypothetical protein
MKKIFESIKSSGRELLFSILAFSLFSFLADSAANFAAESNFGLVNLIALFSGVAKFGAVMLCVWLGGVAISFPNTVSEFINKEFESTWKELTNKTKFFTSLGVAGAIGLIAAICFIG